VFSLWAWRFGLVRVNVRARRTALLAMLVFAALPAGSALADTTIGQVGATDVIACGSPAVFADTNYVVPAGGGFITSFSFQSESGNAGNQVASNHRCKFARGSGSRV
jgi:hypothetical protein